MRRIIIPFILTALSLLVSLGLVEVALRMQQSVLSQQRWSDRPAHYYTGSSARYFQDFPEGFNPSAQHKIAAIGDSFTFATSMQIDDAFPAKLERYLQYYHGQSVSVKNYGVPGYSTYHEIQSVQAALDQGATMIVLQVTLNDPQVKPFRPSGISGVNDFGPLELQGFEASVAETFKLYHFVRNRIHNTQTHQRYVEYYQDLFSNPKTWPGFRKSFKRIVQLCRSRSVKIAVVLFPLFGTELGPAYPFVNVHDQIKKLAENRDVPLIDLLPYYTGIALDRIQVEPGIDFHPNEIAHRIAAEAIGLWLVEDLRIIS